MAKLSQNLPCGVHFTSRLCQYHVCRRIAAQRVQLKRSSKKDHFFRRVKLTQAMLLGC